MKPLLFILLLCPLLTDAQIITTIAGNGNYGSTGDLGPATAASIDPMYSCALDNHGNLFFGEYNYHKVRKVSTAGVVTTIAGTGVSGYNGDNILSNSAELDHPVGVAVDGTGNIYIAEATRIRKIDAGTGIINTVAGNGFDTGIIFGGPATATCVGYPTAMCVDNSGSLFILTSASVFKVDRTGIITSVTGGSGSGSSGFSLPLFYTPQPAISVSFPGAILSGICIDTMGDLFVSYNWLPDHTYVPYSGIFKIDTSGLLAQYAGNGYGGYSGDGGLAIDAKTDASGLSTDKSGNLYFSNDWNVRRVDYLGIICTVAGNGTFGYSGDGGNATAAQLKPFAVATDSFGNLYIADTYGLRIRKVTQPECDYFSVTAIPAVTGIYKFSIYPNPAKTQMTISSTAKIKIITINDLLGQVVYHNNYDSERVQIDVATLPAGLYFVKINGSDVLKFAKE